MLEDEEEEEFIQPVDFFMKQQEPVKNEFKDVPMPVPMPMPLNDAIEDDDCDMQFNAPKIEVKSESGLAQTATGASKVTASSGMVTFGINVTTNSGGVDTYGVGAVRAGAAVKARREK